ncbi:unnamed protein product [Discosporangium mesarthrocarpum]
MVGDLRHGRTVHSLARLLSRSGGAGHDCRLCYVSPEALSMPQDVKDEVGSVSAGGRVISQTEHRQLGEVIAQTDVLYVTRVQKERFASDEASTAEYEQLKCCYCVTPEVLAKAKPTAVLMHPLPRVGEISEACDTDPRAAYFRQMENGMFVRMALLALLLGKA